jgi:phosphoserine phosphatase RsbU/P
MLSAGLVITLTLLYVGLLFAVALFAQKRQRAGKSIVNNSTVYTLSLAVYLTTWTYYGSVGRAATSGLDFLPIYIGPTLVAFCWWFTVRKLVRICKANKIVSVADFISSRYGKSVSLGALVTLFTLVGITPYIALQLKAVSRTFDIITTANISGVHRLAQHYSGVPEFIDTALIFSVVLGLFAILFGARTLDSSESHDGMVATIAFESIVKLVAILMVGVYVTYFLFDGFSDVFTQATSQFPQVKQAFLLGKSGATSYAHWFSLTFIAMAAVMFLPRQFHMLVIENNNEEHIRQAMWKFPAYMFLITLFATPIAMAGLLFNQGSTTGADFFVLQLPLQHGQKWLALFVYIGGFSAAAGMIIVESMAMATMLLNHLFVPVLLRFNHNNERDFSRLLINLKRMGILLVLGLGYLYHRTMADTKSLVDIGLISFVAVTQFVPAMVGGLYWKRANHFGVTVGLLLGFSIWTYTLLVPAFASAGLIPNSIVVDGPFQIGLLRPLELFGLTGLDVWSHALFWSFFFNFGSFLTISLLTQSSNEEREQAHRFVDVFAPYHRPTQLTRMVKAPTIIEFVELIGKFIGRKQAESAITEYLSHQEIEANGKLSEEHLPALKNFTELTLAGSVGAAPAKIIVENYLATRGSRMEDVFNVFGSVTLSRTSSREQLAVLYDVARKVGSGTSLKSTLDDILSLISHQFRIDLCVIWLYEPSVDDLLIRAKMSLNTEVGVAVGGILHDPLLKETFVQGSANVINDLGNSHHLHHTYANSGIKALLHVPIIAEGDTVGVLSAYSIAAKGLFTDEFVELLTSVANQIGIAWRNSCLTEEMIAVKEQEKELEIAKHIQHDLLPDKAPDVEGIELYGLCVPANQIGGDYYDYLHRDRERIDLVIADVSGHSIGAALLIAETRAFIRAKAESLQGPAQIIRAVNAFILTDLDRAEMFITLFYASYDAINQTLRYASAGHNNPMIWRAATGLCDHLDVNGLILGVKPDVIYEEKETEMASGDLLILFTDGLTEAENHTGDFFGEERLEELLREYHLLPTGEIIDRIMEQARLFTGTRSFRDDVTIVLMKIL